MSGGEFTDKTRKAITDRADKRCEVCGSIGATQIHHRQPRGMGGSKQPATRSAANGIYIHADCHRRIELNRAKSYLLGHLVRMNFLPNETPIRLWDGWWVLDDDGGRQPAPDS